MSWFDKLFDSGSNYTATLSEMREEMSVYVKLRTIVKKTGLSIAKGKDINRRMSMVKQKLACAQKRKFGEVTNLRLVISNCEEIHTTVVGSFGIIQEGNIG